MKFVKDSLPNKQLAGQSRPSSAPHVADVEALTARVVKLEKALDSVKNVLTFWLSRNQ